MHHSKGELADGCRERSWITLYPIYIDAKRPNTAGMRRVPKSKALPWPIAESMAKACATFGLQVVFEVPFVLQLLSVTR